MTKACFYIIDSNGYPKCLAERAVENEKDIAREVENLEKDYECKLNYTIEENESFGRKVYDVTIDEVED